MSRPSTIHMRNGGVRDQTTDPLVSGWPALPPEPHQSGRVYRYISAFHLWARSKARSVNTKDWRIILMVEKRKRWTCSLGEAVAALLGLTLLSVLLCIAHFRKQDHHCVSEPKFWMAEPPESPPAFPTSHCSTRSWQMRIERETPTLSQFPYVPAHPHWLNKHMQISRQRKQGDDEEMEKYHMSPKSQDPKCSHQSSFCVLLVSACLLLVFHLQSSGDSKVWTCVF